MLAARASSAFVCIRCELKLARTPFSALSRRSSHANFSASSTARNEDGRAALLAAHEAHEDPKRLSPRPLGRTKRRKGEQTLKETTARLGGIKTMGDDAEILVLREVGDQPSRGADSTAHVDPPPEVVPVDLTSLQKDTALSPAEINAQLETLRPKSEGDPTEPVHITQATFIKLQRVLNQGFTMQQLSQYYSAAKNVQEDQVDKEVMDDLKRAQAAETHSQGTGKRPLERTEWSPGTTQLNRRLPGLDVTYRPKRRPVSKQLLIDQILRNVWNIVLLEEIEAPGEIELLLKPWQIVILSAGSPSHLDTVGNERKAKIEIHHYHNVVRITADKTTAEYAADDIEKLLHTSTRKQYRLSNWAPFLADDVPRENLTSIFTAPKLELIANQSRTFVHVVSSSDLLIRALDQNSLAEAERCIISMLPQKVPGLHKYDTHRLDAFNDQVYLNPPSFNDSLDSTLRDMSLGRWHLPIRKRAPEIFNEEETDEQDLDNVKEDESIAQGREIPVHKQTTEESDEKTTDDQDLGNVKEDESLAQRQKILDRFLPVFEKAFLDEEHRSRAEEVGWTSPKQIISVQYGHALFPSTSSASDIAKTGQHLLSSRAPFSHVCPGLPQLMMGGQFTSKFMTPVPSLEYEFVPEPSQILESQWPYPRLSIQFRYPPGGSPFLKKATLTYGEQIHDVLLPDKTVDLRFSFYQKLEIDKTLEIEAVEKFASKVISNLRGGGRVTAPRELTLKIPKEFLAGHHPDTWKSHSATYLFTGVRLRQTVVSTSSGMDLAYSTVQSGKLGWKGNSLSSYMEVLHGSGNSTQELTPERFQVIREDLNKFVRRSFRVADRLTDAAYQQDTPGRRKARFERMEADANVSVVKKPGRHPDGARRLRRLALQPKPKEVDPAVELEQLVKEQAAEREAKLGDSSPDGASIESSQLAFAEPEPSQMERGDMEPSRDGTPQAQDVSTDSVLDTVGTVDNEATKSAGDDVVVQPTDTEHGNDEQSSTAPTEESKPTAEAGQDSAKPSA